jgi:hypothetical protein
MATNTFNIEESGLEKNASKEMILNLLNQQIAHYKLQHLKSWEKNHSLSSKSTNEIIEALRSQKEDIEAFFKDCAANQSFDVNISIEVKVKQDVLETAYA